VRGRLPRYIGLDGALRVRGGARLHRRACAHTTSGDPLTSPAQPFSEREAEGAAALPAAAAAPAAAASRLAGGEEYVMHGAIAGVQALLCGCDER